MPTQEIIKEVDTTTKLRVKPPNMFQVVLLNDDKTTMEFVITILMAIFHKSFEDATQLTMQIHEQGKGVAGVYPFEVATQKRDETISVARANMFPLQAEVKEN